MSFSSVLREVIEQDDGLVLHLSSFQGLHAIRQDAGGVTAGFWRRMKRRSRMILAAVGALGACSKKEEE